MPRGDKSKYTDKQKRQAEHIEAGYRERGLKEDEAERRAWATVNKASGGGEKPGGSGYGRKTDKSPMKGRAYGRARVGGSAGKGAIRISSQSSAHPQGACSVTVQVVHRQPATMSAIATSWRETLAISSETP